MVTTFDALVEAAARELWRIGNERIGERPWETVAAHYLAEAAGALNVALELVHEGGGTLTETECPSCAGGKVAVHADGCEGSEGSCERLGCPVAAPCPACSGAGRQWQIGKLTVTRFGSSFVPRSEGDKVESGEPSPDPE